MKDRKLEILKDIFGDCKKEGKGQYLFYCPFCPTPHHKAKLSINIEKNKFKCWVCGKSGSDVKKLVQEKGEFHHLREWREIEGITDFSDLKYLFHITNELPKEKEKLLLPEEFKTFVTNNLSVEGRLAKNYLLKRGISEKDIFLYKMGYCVSGRFENRIVIPSFDENGHLNYFIARTFSNDKRKYLYPHIKHSEIIVNDLYIDWNKPIILVEGIFDALKSGIQAIPLLGSELKIEGKLFQKIIKHNCKVLIALDNDAKDKEIRIVEKLLQYGINISKILIPEQFNDIGEMTKEQFNEIKINNTFLLTRDSILCYKLR